MNYTDKQLLDKIKSLPTYNRGKGNALIIGVQSKIQGDDSFNDKFYVYNDADKFVIATTGTTNCGQSALKNYGKFGLKGAAVWKTNQFYEGLYRLGFHKGKMPALIQQKPIALFRDSDKDNIPEQEGIEFNDIIGANFHGVSYNIDSDKLINQIGEWSYACPVCNNMRHYRSIINFAKKYSFIDYCLLNEF